MGTACWTDLALTGTSRRHTWCLGWQCRLFYYYFLSMYTYRTGILIFFSFPRYYSSLRLLRFLAVVLLPWSPLLNTLCRTRQCLVVFLFVCLFVCLLRSHGLFLSLFLRGVLTQRQKSMRLYPPSHPELVCSILFAFVFFKLLLTETYTHTHAHAHSLSNSLVR